VSALSDVFVLDVGDGANRYVMTKAPNLEPLLDLPRTRVVAQTAPGGLLLRNEGDVTAVGVVLVGGDRTLFSDNVLDLLPGEEREIAVEGEPAEIVLEGWNVAV
jgi:hypothetical protein